MCNKDKIVYISGPMTGIKDLNFPAFFEAEEKLVKLGYTVINPARNPNPDPISWEGFMRMSIIQVCECTDIALLDNWSDSRGAVIETKIAKALKINIKKLSSFN